MNVAIRPLDPGDEDVAERLVDAVLAGRWQARLGALVDVLHRPGFVAVRAGDLLGVATFADGGERAELAALAVADGRRRAGIGTALVEEVAATTRTRGARELWLVTTNDNIDALRFYQRRGFRLAELHAGSLDHARTLKPSIPEIGSYGIPMHDELVLTRPLA